VWVGVNRSAGANRSKTCVSRQLRSVSGLIAFGSSKTDPDILWNYSKSRIRGCVTPENRNFDVTVHDSDRSSPCVAGAYSVCLIDQRGTFVGCHVGWSLVVHIRCAAFFHPYNRTRNRGLNYYASQRPQGNLWLGGNLGLHRFDPNTMQFNSLTAQVSDDTTSLATTV